MHYEIGTVGGKVTKAQEIFILFDVDFRLYEVKDECLSYRRYTDSL